MATVTTTCHAIPNLPPMHAITNGDTQRSNPVAACNTVLCLQLHTDQIAVMTHNGTVQSATAPNTKCPPNMSTTAVTTNIVRGRLEHNTSNMRSRVANDHNTEGGSRPSCLRYSVSARRCVYRRDTLRDSATHTYGNAMHAVKNPANASAHMYIASSCPTNVSHSAAA